MRILIVVTHLLGAGHLRRSLNLAQAFRNAKHDVTLLTGGVPIPQIYSDDVSVVQLPPVRSDGVNFRHLVQPDGNAVTESYLSARAIQLNEVLHSQLPDVLITELFPFGRRILKTEFESLLRAAACLTPKPIVLSSVRDILSPPSTTRKALETDRLVQHYYDGVLVHSDEQTTSLDSSWPVTEAMSRKLRYTGYVSQPLTATTSASSGRKEIIVSAGTGSVGGNLFDVALATAGLTQEYSWRILVGGSDAEVEVSRLKNAMASIKSISDQVVAIEPARRDFHQLLQHALCSVSMCGYNTAVDLLQTGTPGVLVPFDAGGETEQKLRAGSLSRHASFRCILSQDLTPATLLQSIGEVRRSGRFRADPDQFEGAAESVRIAEELVKERVVQ